MVEQGVAEFENTLAEYFQVGGSRVKGEEMKADLLATHAAELRETLFWKATDDGPFKGFRDMVISQAGKIVMKSAEVAGPRSDRGRRRRRRREPRALQLRGQDHCSHQQDER